MSEGYIQSDHHSICLDTGKVGSDNRRRTFSEIRGTIGVFTWNFDEETFLGALKGDHSSNGIKAMEMAGQLCQRITGARNALMPRRCWLRNRKPYC